MTILLEAARAILDGLAVSDFWGPDPRTVALRRAVEAAEKGSAVVTEVDEKPLVRLLVTPQTILDVSTPEYSGSITADEIVHVARTRAERDTVVGAAKTLLREAVSIRQTCGEPLMGVPQRLLDELRLALQRIAAEEDMLR